MKFIILIAFLFQLISCASYKNPREIKQSNLDGLKFESLKRYDKLRLEAAIKKNDPLALCHAQKFEKAQDLLKEKLDQNLNNYNYWNTVSTCYIIQKEYTQARHFLNLALSRAKKKSEKAIVLNNIGVVLLENKKFEEAKDYFQKSIELNKSFLTPKFNIVQIYLKFGIYGKAEKEINHLLKNNSNDVDFLNAKAYLQLMQKEYQNALVYFNRIPKEYRSRDDIATNMAMTYYMLGLYENVKTTLSAADKDDTFYLAKQLEITKRLEKRIEK